MDADDRLAALLGAAKPASDGLLFALAQAVNDRSGHEHDLREDWYCTNLVAYMGERMAPVLRRLLNAEQRVAALEVEAAELRHAADTTVDERAVPA